MAHFAEIDENNIVVRVLVVDDANASDGQTFLAETLGLGGRWIQTSYNTYGGVHKNGGTPLRKNYAGQGFLYDEERDAFIPPKPFPSWILNEESCIYEAPIPSPTEGTWAWDEELGNWKEI